MDTRKRSAVKTISWHVVATAITASILYIATGKAMLVLVVAVIDITLNMVAYYLHERAWDAIPFGRDPEDQT